MRASMLLGGALAGALALAATSPARADATVAGQWNAHLGSRVTVGMDVSPDGHWSSETRQAGKVVAQMSGTYEQTAKSPTSGTLVFTPTTGEANAQHGAPEVEHDTYHIASRGKVMRLTSGGDTMVFHKK